MRRSDLHRLTPRGKPRCRLSPPRDGVDPMHRQIAGKLTGPVTKWIVLAAWLVLSWRAGLPRRPSSPTSRTTRRPPGSPSSAESTKVADELSGDGQTPTTSRRWWSTTATAGSPTADLAAIDEQAAEIAEIDGVTEEGVLTPNAAAALQAQGRTCHLSSEDGEVAYTLLHLQLRQGRLEQDPGPRRRDPRHRRRSTASTSTSRGFGGQASDFVEAVRRHRTSRCCWSPSAW